MQFLLSFLVFIGLLCTLSTRAEEKKTSSNQIIELPTVEVLARLSTARNTISPSLGATSYHVGTVQLTQLAQGVNNGVNHVLLHTPGMAQDSYGQVHMRGEHANLQYRINNILLPEGISGFGQELDAHFLKSLDIVTGALPAQYGLRTAGVIDIETKQGDSQSVGHFLIKTGSLGMFQPSLDYGGTQGNLTYFFNGSYLQNNLGIENPTSSTLPIHDTTQQYKGFGYLSYLLDTNSSINLMLGGNSSQFQLPNSPDLVQGTDANGTPFSVPNTSSFDSKNLNETQDEKNHFEVISYQTSTDDFNGQVSFLNRYSSVVFHPDKNGDLFFNGVASFVDRSVSSQVLQADGSYTVTPMHTLRGGALFTVENSRSNTTTTVFNTDSNGNAIGTPVDIIDNNSKSGYSYGLYLQDEWKISNDWTLNLGTRFDAIQTYTNDSQLSPRLNVTYQVSKGTIVHAGYARYFTPAPIEGVQQKTLAKFNNTTNAAQVTQNTPVQAEKSNYFDVGITHQLTPALQLGLEGYYKESENQLDEGQFGSALILSPFNYKTGKVYGVEGSLTYEKEGVSAYANLALSYASGREITSGQFLFEQDELDYIKTHDVALDHDQRLTGSAGIAYQFSGYRIYSDLLFGSGLRQGFANTGTLPSYTTVNLGLSYTATDGIFEKWTARLDAINIFDAVYVIRDGSGIGVSAAQYGMRRGLSATLTVKF